MAQFPQGEKAVSFEFQMVAHAAPDNPGLASINGIFASPTALSSSSKPTDDLKASRIFAGPDNFPPKNFAAYGLVAFNSVASTENGDRYKMFCRAYVNSVPASAQVVKQWNVPLSS